MNTDQQLGLEGIAIQRSADFSPCRTWRYTLKRRWDDDLPSLLCVLLNPSTANEYRDDPANTRCIRWAIRFGYGSLTFCNLFAFRTPDPHEMMKADDPIGAMNNLVIRTEIAVHDVVVAGWGNHGTHLDRANDVLPMSDKWQCFGVNWKTGQPKHPLYMRGDTELAPYVYQEPMQTVESKRPSPDDVEDNWTANEAH